ncbi:amidase [Bacillus daqingensis]
MEKTAYTQPDVRLPGEKSGPLQGKTFAVKDVFHVKGTASTAGNPDWLRTHPPASTTAPALEILLKAGASIQGLTVTDELMYSLHGENAHYGTPLNPLAPESIPGGSSSGSASAAASGDCDFAVGTDTGGSIRIPAAYCGLYGLRPTHGRISTAGLIPLAPSFDTIGLLSPDFDTLQQAASLFYPQTDEGPTDVYFLEEAWELAEDKQIMDQLDPLPVKSGGLSLAHLQETFRVVQAAEIWEQHGTWVTEHAPAFGPGIKERFEAASRISAAEAAEAVAERNALREQLQQLAAGSILVIPTAPGPAPAKNLPPVQVDDIRTRSLRLCAIAGIGGLPQLTIPIKSAGRRISFSVIGAPGSENSLFSWVGKHISNDEQRLSVSLL